MKRPWRLIVALLVLLSTCARGAETLHHMTFKVDGVTREALVHIPTDTNEVSRALVFVFHGHGGSAENAARTFAIEREWPEAITVYMQGLKTPGQLTDLEGHQTGWQGWEGDQGDRDLKFFDAALAQLEHDYHVDPKRIYCTGHSNGGLFVYELWLTRPDIFAAVAPSAAVAKWADQLAPKPALIMAAHDDPLVSFSWQSLTMAVVRHVNGCSSVGEPWEQKCTIYQSPTGTPLVTFTYPGGHEFNSASPALIVKFFREHPGAEKQP